MKTKTNKQKLNKLAKSLIRIIDMNVNLLKEIEAMESTDVSKKLCESESIERFSTQSFPHKMLCGRIKEGMRLLVKKATMEHGKFMEYRKNCDIKERTGVYMMSAADRCIREQNISLPTLDKFDEWVQTLHVRAAVSTFVGNRSWNQIIQKGTSLLAIKKDIAEADFRRKTRKPLIVTKVPNADTYERLSWKIK